MVLPQLERTSDGTPFVVIPPARDGDFASERRITRAVHLSHPACAEQRQNLEPSKPMMNAKGHEQKSTGLEINRDCKRG